MTGSGLNVITKNTIQSYNTTVSAINNFQKENIGKLQKSIVSCISTNSKLNKSISLLVNSIVSLQKQVFLNQVLIDNWERNEPYIIDDTILE